MILLYYWYKLIKILTVPSKKYWNWLAHRILPFNSYFKFNGPFSGIQQISYIGNKVSINGNFVIKGKGKLVIDDGVHIGENVKIFTSNHNYKFPTTLPYDNEHIIEDVIIEGGVWIGDNVIINAGVKIPYNCIIASGTILTKRTFIQPNYTVSANYYSARPNLEHITKLFNRDKFKDI